MRFGNGFCLIALLLGLMAMAIAGTPGSFRGTIVDRPTAEKGWLYVQGRNGTARRVEISHAQIVYDEDVPTAERRPNPEDALVVGTEVRVTAEQGSDGEWRASQVEILKPAVQPSTAANQASSARCGSAGLSSVSAY
jgi:hypothetical protein